MKELIFEEIEEGEFLGHYTGTCSKDKSCCCSRTGCSVESYCCHPKPKDAKLGIKDFATAAEWGKFLEIEGGVIQY